MLADSQRDRFEIVLVRPRNPLNIGAAARAMANFGFARLTVVAPYEPHWREAKSAAVGATELLQNAKGAERLDEAIADCTFVAATGSLEHRTPAQPVVSLPDLASEIRHALVSGGRAALVFGPEKHGLTRDDLAHCHVLVQIPTHPAQPSMNLGQAVAVCLYELARPVAEASQETLFVPPASHPAQPGVASAVLDLLAEVIEETMLESGYSPSAMRAANRLDLRLLLRRIALTDQDARRSLRFFRRILWRLRNPPPAGAGNPFSH